MNTSVKLSVIVCSHNPRRDFLSKTLAALQDQTLEKSQWELLLIDNRSAPPLKDLFSIEWHGNARIVHEEKLGLTNARLRGISESALIRWGGGCFCR